MPVVPSLRDVAGRAIGRSCPGAHADRLVVRPAGSPAPGCSSSRSCRCSRRRPRMPQNVSRAAQVQTPSPAARRRPSCSGRSRALSWAASVNEPAPAVVCQVIVMVAARVRVVQRGRRCRPAAAPSTDGVVVGAPEAARIGRHRAGVVGAGVGLAVEVLDLERLRCPGPRRPWSRVRPESTVAVPVEDVRLAAVQGDAWGRGSPERSSCGRCGSRSRG